MKLVISPAKKMVENGLFDIRSMPYFIDETKELLAVLRELDDEELARIWNANEKITKLNLHRIRTMDLDKAVFPAIFSYEGLQYSRIKPFTFTKEELDVLNDSLYIMSGFYGILRPFDGIKLYRLEMESKHIFSDGRSLYDFWGDKLYKVIFNNDELVVNLASKEYWKAVEPYIHEDDKYVNISFKSLKNGKLVQKATEAKMARGEMVAFVCKNKITDVSGLRHFCEDDFRYSEKHSDDKNLVFIKEENR